MCVCLSVCMGGGYVHACVCVHTWLCNVDDSEMEAKLCLQEEHIHRLKQQIGTMQWRIEELEYENEHLRSQHFSATVKEEGIMTTTVISLV